MARRSNQPPRKPTKLSGKSGSASWSNGSARRHLPDVRIDRAQDAWAARQFDEAIRLYESALARDPHNAVLLVDVARAYALRYRVDDAERLIELAERLYPADVHLQQMLGRSYVQLQQFDRAIACFERSLTLAPESPERAQILLELARMHERLHQLDAARGCAELALAAAPQLERARWQLGVCKRRLGHADAAEATWLSIIEANRAAPIVIADCWYELAMMRDKQRRFEEAYDALRQAKALLTRAAAPQREDAAAISAVSGRNVAALTLAHCERWVEEATRLTPLPGGLALLTSHPRSGTTLLEQVLDAHSAVTSADELQVMPEMVYEPLGQYSRPGESVVDTLDRLSPDQLDPLRRTYWSSMEGALRTPLSGRMLLDKNPELTMLLPVVARSFPEMRIVFALRDPRDVVLSCYMQRLPLNAVSVHYLTLESAAEKYARTMRAWLKLRETIRNPWLEVRYEETVADLTGQARRVLEFLGLPWDDAVLDYRRRTEQKHVHSPTYEAVTKPIYASSIGRWRNYARQLEPVQKILQPYIDAFGYEAK
ncbi:MAG: sulfotransferase [Planctomycetaceae bacterium]|nr:sulfotransferase [Planctomycetaceae bacterium]